MFAHLSINSIRNKYELLKDPVKVNIDILMISQTKIDDIFPQSQFLIERFRTPHRLYHDSNGVGIHLYVREDIHFKLIAIENKSMINDK